MTVKELIAQLKKMPATAHVMVEVEANGSADYRDAITLQTNDLRDVQLLRSSQSRESWVCLSTTNSTEGEAE